MSRAVKASKIGDESLIANKVSVSDLARSVIERVQPN